MSTVIAQYRTNQKELGVRIEIEVGKALLACTVKFTVFLSGTFDRLNLF